MSLANLADAGVPGFDELRLVHLDFERTDATRISAEYHRQGGLKTGVNILGWVANTPRQEIEKLIQGRDRRRLDYDLENTLARLRESAAGTEP